MSVRYLILALLIAVVIQPVKGSAPPVVLTHVTVIDATGGPARPDSTVVLTGDRIKAIGKTGKLKWPKDAQIIDATGKFLIPGLWDMHAHNSYRSFLTLFVANGVTSLRDMGGTPDEFALLKQWKKEIANGMLVGPRIFAAGILVDGPLPSGRPDSLNVANDREAREAVRTLKRQGADFVKVYSMLPREAYFAIADEARKQGLTFAGHIPASISAAEASDAGQKSIEHHFGVLAACSTEEAVLMQESLATISKSPFGGFIKAEMDAQLKSLDSYDAKKAAQLFARFAKNGTWHVPTLIGWRNLTSPAMKDFANEPRGKYIPVERRESWNERRLGFQKLFSSGFETNKTRLFQRHLEIVAAMRRAGVQIMAGTDTAGYYTYPGFSLHDELALLVEAGLTPMEALQTATRNPAQYVGMLKSLGTVEAGKIADLVLLSANPLDDIRNTQKIAAVILSGRVIDEEALSELLAQIEVAAKAK